MTTALDVPKLYQTALLAYLKGGRAAQLQAARGIGDQALAADLNALDMAKIHERILIDRILTGVPVRRQASIIAKAGAFFAAAMNPAGSTARYTRDAISRLRSSVESLSQRTVELAAANLALSIEVTQRKAAEATLKQSEQRYAKLLDQSDRLQDQLRHMSRQILSAQEEERKNISRELHDVIAQTLTGISVRLAALKKEASIDADGLQRNIVQTQQLVVKAVDVVHRFARELRPAALDDLGLTPALRAYAKHLSAGGKIQVRVTAYRGVDRLKTTDRTVLFRVAQEALTNVVRHARAHQVEVLIKRTRSGMRMEIHDDGRAFQVERVLQARHGKRLGLLGMRERLEMIDGTFAITSAPGKGTTVTASLPRNGATPRRKRSTSVRHGKATA